MASKQDMVNAIAEQNGLTKKETEATVSAVFDFITDTLQKGHSFSFVGFGTFEVRERAVRKGRNPQTGEEITIAAFKAGKSLKDAVKN